MRAALNIIIIFGILFTTFFFGSISQAVASQESFTDFIADPKSGLICFDYLVRLDNLIKITALRSTESNIVVVGKEGHLYVNVDESMADYRGLVPYTENQLSYTLDLIESERKYLNERGIQLLLVVAPNKETVYPEYLPDFIKKIQPMTRMDQITQYLRDHSDIQILDLRPVMLDARKSQQVYFRTDHHWNNDGAFVAYTNIMPSIGLNPHTLADYNFIDDPPFSGDSGRLLKMSDIYTEPAWHRELKDGIKSEKISKAVIFHDSFYGNTDLKKLMAPHFDNVKEMRFGQLELFSSRLIEQEKPDIVIYIMLERIFARYFMPWS